MFSHLRKLGSIFEVSNDKQIEEDFRAKAPELITIENILTLSQLKLNFLGQETVYADKFL